MNPRAPFRGRILITGFGVVAQALLPLLLKHLRVPCDRITVIEFAERPQLRPWREKGVRLVRERVTPSNLGRLLGAHAGPGDLLIDLTWSIDFFAILEWARDHNVLYTNASLESWDPAYEMESSSALDKSVYSRYARAMTLLPRWRGAATAVCDHGANPGLISHFVKQGLLDIAARELRGRGTSLGRRRRLERFVDRGDFAGLARALGVKVIHCSERDTQRAMRSTAPDEFVNTWSVEGLWEEAIAPAELGWGTHEKRLPPMALRPRRGPRNQIILRQMGLNTFVRSWVPSQEIVGMMMPHGETFTLSNALTVRENGKAAYRPTVHYAYLPSNAAMISLHELRCNNYQLHPRARILTDEIVEGKDTMGALIMGHRYKAWWIGSRLSIDDARRKVKSVNATALQVSAGLISGILWALENPRRGLCFPEDLPHREILRHAGRYLGRLISTPVDWTPLDNFHVHFGDRPLSRPDRGDPWQYRNFAFQP
jgi:homospermidine synthase